MVLDEITRKDLTKGVDRRSKRNAKQIKRVVYKGITKDNVIKCEALSSSGRDWYKVTIELSELKDLMPMDDLTSEEKIRLALFGDVKVSCDCPAAKYWGYNYITTQLGAKDGDPEDREPIVKNPNLEGTLCKHAYVTVKSIGRIWKRIAKDIDTKRYIT